MKTIYRAGTIKRERRTQSRQAQLPANALHVAQVAERSERRHINRMAALLSGGAV